MPPLVSIAMGVVYGCMLETQAGNGCCVTLLWANAEKWALVAHAVHPKLFGHSNHRAQLNQRLVNIVSESEQGGKLPAAELKALVSGETMTVDRKFEHPFKTLFFINVLI